MTNDQSTSLTDSTDCIFRSDIPDRLCGLPSRFRPSSFLPWTRSWPMGWQGTSQAIWKVMRRSWSWSWSWCWWGWWWCWDVQKEFKRILDFSIYLKFFLGWPQQAKVSATGCWSSLSWWWSTTTWSSRGPCSTPWPVCLQSCPGSFVATPLLQGEAILDIISKY